jgi:protein SCO1/2
MNKFFKAGILVAILVIPVFVFLYLKYYSKNYYRLTVFYAQDSVLLDKSYKITKAHQIPSFSFLNQDSLLISSDTFGNKIMVVDFFFTRCQTICPKMTNNLALVKDELNDADIQFVSFTVDPNYDKPWVLKKHISSKSVDLNGWMFLTGVKDSIYNLAQKGFFLSAMEDPEHPVDFIHSDKVVLVDRNKWIRGYYNGTDKKDMDRLIAEIKVLKQIEKDEQQK